jgi:hypothetical protein
LFREYSEYPFIKLAPSQKAFAKACVGAKATRLHHIPAQIVAQLLLEQTGSAIVLQRQSGKLFWQMSLAGLLGRARSPACGGIGPIKGEKEQ